MLADLGKPARFRCQKHGDIGTLTMTVSIQPDGQPQQQFDYCMFCFNEMIAKHCHQVVQVSDKACEEK